MLLSSSCGHCLEVYSYIYYLAYCNYSLADLKSIQAAGLHILPIPATSSISQKFPTNNASSEQPSAPTTDIDPLAQEPQVDYKPQTLDAKTDATGTASDIKSTTAVTLPKSTETPSSNTQTAPVATEQRSTESAEKSESTENAESAAAGGSGSGSGSGIGSDKSSNSEEVAAKHGVSKEALVGPQGPAPHPASEFEDEAKGKKPAAKEAKPGKQIISYGLYLLS